MARGQGPKLVVDVGVDLKRRLHGRLALDGRTVKDWLTERIENFLEGPVQLPLYPSDDLRSAPDASRAEKPAGQTHANVLGRGSFSKKEERPAGRKRSMRPKTARSNSR